MKQELLSLPVTQSDETPTQVIGDSGRPNSKCYMWVHRSGEFYKERPVVIYEYQKGRGSRKAAGVLPELQRSSGHGQSGAVSSAGQKLPG